MERLPAYLLAGGRSRRFGTDKARALVDGAPLLVHVARAAAPVAASIAVIADRAGKYDDLGFATHADAVAEQGPIGGLLTACRLSGGEPFLLLSCDLLGLRAEWLRLLMACYGETTSAVCFQTDRWHPMPGIYNARIATEIEGHLAAGRRDLQSLLDRLPAVAVAPPDDWFGLVNVNTHTDLPAAAAASLPSPPPGPANDLSPERPEIR
jgi:molybdopterin-guanine dinucleotide biosynthesis protein A